MTNRTLQKRLFQTSTTFIGIAVLLGAFGAHGLKNSATLSEQDLFRTGVNYHFIHSIGILTLALGLRRLREKTLQIVFGLFVTGIVLFSGSLYILAMRTALDAGDMINWVGMITPIGGLCFLGGWFYLALNGYKPVDHDHHEGHNSSAK